MKKIALTGAHGTGKTTLANELIRALAYLGRTASCREAPRLIIDLVGDQEFFRRGNNTPLRQGIIFLEHVLEESRNLDSCDVLIADRTLIDHLAYTAVLFPETESTIEFAAYRKISFDTLQGYERIYKIPIEFPVEDDGVREAAIEFQAQVNRKIDDLYEEARYQPTIITGSVEERVKKIVKSLS